jgi:hypothetical protein
MLPTANQKVNVDVNLYIMEKQKILKGLKILTGIYLFYLSYKFLDSALHLYQESYDYLNSSLDVFMPNIINPNIHIFFGIFFMLVSLFLITKRNVFLTISILFSLSLLSYEITHLVLFSFFKLQFDISFDFFNNVFVFLGMLFSSIIICVYNNFDWKNQIVIKYKYSVLFGNVLGIIEFLRVYILYYR